MQYRATRDGVDIDGGPSVTRTGGKIVAKLADGSTLDAPAGATTVIAPQSIAEFVWYGEQLASAKVGDTVKLAAVAVMTEGAPRLDPVALTFTRRPDADGRRSFELTGTYGALPVKGTFTLDPDGAPNTVEIEVTWGKLVTRRTPTP
jgi:hypothetical protein